MSTHQFQTEVNQLLRLIIHSMYSNREIFLRELISNSSDALDRLRYLTYVDDELKKINLDPRIDIEFDAAKRTLSVADNGIGMNDQDLVENLGTIARSGTADFFAKLSSEERKDANMIGQFGVGFYSSFMVAERVEVISRKAGEEKAYLWSSDGKGEYEISEGRRDSQGTTVLLHLTEEGREFSDRHRITGIIKKYSNHIPFPIYLHYEEKKFEGEGAQRKQTSSAKTEKINEATALWRRPKAELRDEDYKEFYKVISHENGDPLLYCHTHAEGTMAYTPLFYVPSKAPMDIYFSDYRPGVKLYVKRVFITDSDRDLLPPYLRFIRGVIDTEDLPLNVSREMLQQNRILARIKSASVKKILSELQRLAEDGEGYAKFYMEFGRQIKEGLYADFENREILLELVRFKSTAADGYTSLAEYKTRMKPDQKAIYYVTGEKESTLRYSPLLEMYRDRGIEVLLMDDEIDEIIVPAVGRYGDLEFKSINRSDSAEELKTDSDRESERSVEPVIKRIREILKDRVKDVRASTRLSESPSCIVVDEKDPSVQMQGILKAMGHSRFSKILPILERNPTHRIIKRFEEIKEDAVLDDIAHLLLEQAMLVEGVKLEDPAAFVKRLNRITEMALPG